MVLAYPDRFYTVIWSNGTLYIHQQNKYGTKPLACSLAMHVHVPTWLCTWSAICTSIDWHVVGVLGEIWLHARDSVWRVVFLRRLHQKRVIRHSERPELQIVIAMHVAQQKHQCRVVVTFVNDEAKNVKTAILGVHGMSWLWFYQRKHW